jgi:hypothetical protein
MLYSVVQEAEYQGTRVRIAARRSIGHARSETRSIDWNTEFDALR